MGKAKKARRQPDETSRKFTEALLNGNKHPVSDSYVFVLLWCFLCHSIAMVSGGH